MSKLYRSYVFKDKDPIIDAIRTAYEDAGGSYRFISERASVSPSTLRNWFVGSTRRPQFATIAEVAIACGKHGIIFGANGPRLIGRAVPRERRAWTGSKRKRA